MKCLLGSQHLICILDNEPKTQLLPKYMQGIIINQRLPVTSWIDPRCLFIGVIDEEYPAIGCHLHRPPAGEAGCVQVATAVTVASGPAT